MANIDLKVVLLGESGVGKTEFFHAAADATSRACRDNDRRPLGMHQTTIGVDMLRTSRAMRGRTVTAVMWDTAGQERFATTVSFYFRLAHVVFLVYDVTSDDSFTALRTRWYPLVQQYAPKTTSLFVIGTKTDMLHSLSTKAKRAEPSAVWAWAETIGATPLETNSLTKGVRPARSRSRAVIAASQGFLAYSLIDEVLETVLKKRPELLDPCAVEEADAGPRTVRLTGKSKKRAPCCNK